jgi:Zn-dependent peptidase ImmA (M78 family)
MSINLDLMELADFTSPTKIVREILNQNPDIKLPIPLEEIASAAGISDINYHPLDGLEGALVANEEKTEGIIAINSNTILSKQRFTLGHELGHFLIPRHGHNMKCTVKDLKKKSSTSSKILDIEAEANVFASQLLMPPQLLVKRGLLEPSPNVSNIIHLKDICDVSFQACANNYINIHGDYLAIIYSHNKTINYGLNADTNPLWLNVDGGKAIPKGSHTSTVDLSKYQSISSDVVDTDLWFCPNNSYEYPETLVEETYVQENGWAATLLWVNYIEDI